MAQPTPAGGEATPVPAGPVVLVHSPHGGHALDEARTQALLAAAGITVGQCMRITDLYEHEPQGTRWRDEGYAAVIAAGGDGTVGTVASHIAESDLPMGILPMGTANDVARSLGLPLDLAAACRVIARGAMAAVDAGQTLPALTKPGAMAVEPGPQPAGPDAPTPGGGAYFLHTLTLGLNAAFARLATDVARRRRWGPLTYATSALDALRGFHPLAVTLRLRDGSAEEGAGEIAVACEALQVVALNTPIFGGAMELRVPGVDARDRLLDLLVIEALEPEALRQTVDGLLAALERLAETVWPPLRTRADEPSDEALGFALPGVRRFKARAAVLETPQPADVTMDGEIRAHTPVLVRIAPRPVRIFVPAEAAAGAPAASGTVG